MNEFINEQEASIINNEYDYSNILPTIDVVTYLAQYCYNVYLQFME